MAVKSFGFASEEVLGRRMHEWLHHHFPDGRHFPGEECPIYAVAQKNKGLLHVMDTMFREEKWKLLYGGDLGPAGGDGGEGYGGGG